MDYEIKLTGRKRVRNMIKSEQISIIVQGPIYEGYTSQCIESIRRFLPESEIILATWKGMNATKFKVDQILELEDPGTVIQNEQSKLCNNVNRQIYSTVKGIQASTRNYVLKIRTDIELKGIGFLEEFEKDYKRTEELSYFKKRLLICNYYSRNPRIIDTPFHYSDWMAFGLKEDVQKYYDVALQSEEEAQWFKTRDNRSYFYRNYLCRYGAEQHIGIQGITKLRKIKCDCYYDNSKENIFLSEMYLVNNFILFDASKTTIRFLKYNPNRYGDKITLWNQKDWYFLYQNYILKDRKKLAWQRYRFQCFLKKSMSHLLFGFLSLLLEKLKIKNTVRKILKMRQRRKKN